MSGSPPREALLAAVRAACLPGLWSQGVKLAREDAVSVAPSGTELVCRVRAPGRAIAPSVTLYPEDGEWSCDCGSKQDPCAHVAAAAIAAARQPDEAAPAGQASPPRAAAGHLEYRLDVASGDLVVTRWFVSATGEARELEGSLTALVGRGAVPPDVHPSHEDLEADRLLPPSSRGRVALAALRPLLAALASATVRLDGAVVRTSGDPVLPVARLDDGPDGAFRLTLDRDPGGGEVVARGVLRRGDRLCPIGDTEASGFRLERLPLVRDYPVSMRATLAGEILPELERRLTVTVTTRRLPRAGLRIRPRIDLALEVEGGGLGVLATLVYGDPPIARVDGDRLIALGGEAPERQREIERELVSRLRAELDLLPGRRQTFPAADAARFAARARAFHEKSGDLGRARVLTGRPLRPRLVTLPGGGVELRFEEEAAGGGEARRASAASVVAAYREGLDLVPLDGGGFGELPHGFLAEHGHRVAALVAARRPDGEVPPALLPDLAAIARALDAPPPPGLERLRPLIEGFESLPRAPLPPDLRADLRDYQRLGIDWLCFLREAGLGALLADDMGLGKTLQAIAALSGRSLVVAPRSVVPNWQAELARFRPGLRVALHEGVGRPLDPDADVVLTTHALLRLDEESLGSVHWDTLVIDEAQAIKNPESQTAQAAFALRARFRVALSGTPVENRLEELFSLVHFTNPGLLGGLRDFREGLAARISSGDPTAAAALRARLRPFLLRRKKSEVLRELPPRTDHVVPVALHAAERATYDAVRAATRTEVLRELAAGGSVLRALEALLRLRQAACHPALLPGQRAESSSKTEALVDLLLDAAADGHRSLVFSQWTSFLDLVEPALREAGLAFLRLDGSTRDRAGVVADFQRDGGPPVLLLSLKAGGTGLNLTAADHVFLLDPWWNPAVEDQAADRAHRIGQDRPVLVHRLVARDTVEERLLGLQDRKRALAAAALDGGAAVGLTRDDLLALLD